MSARRVVDGVWAVSLGYVNAFIVDGGDGVTLIDAGLPKKVGAIRAAIDQVSRGTALGNIALTHHHVDHRGGLAALREHSRATVWASPLDARIVRGDVPAPPPSPSNVPSKLLAAAIERFGPKGTPCPVDREVADGETLPIAGGLRAVFTPGHTAGHISFLLEAKRTLFAGDAAGNLFGRLGEAPGVYTEDKAEARRSIRKLAELDFDVACFGHGTVLRDNAVAAFRRLADKVAG